MQARLLEPATDERSTIDAEVIESNADEKTLIGEDGALTVTKATNSPTATFMKRFGESLLKVDLQSVRTGGRLRKFFRATTGCIARALEVITCSPRSSATLRRRFQISDEDLKISSAEFGANGRGQEFFEGKFQRFNEASAEEYRSSGET